MILSLNMGLTAILVSAGALLSSATEKLPPLHIGHETATELDHADAAHRHVGIVGAAGMSLHSFLDGVALAAALAVGGGIRLGLGAGGVVHRFSGGAGGVRLFV